MSVAAATDLLFAAYDRGDPNHARAADWVTTTDEELVLTPLGVADLDALVARHGGPDAPVGLWDDLDAGAFTVRWWADALAESLRLARRHPWLGLTGASLLALSERLRTNRIATFDERFRSLTTASGEEFVLLPADA